MKKEYIFAGLGVGVVLLLLYFTSFKSNFTIRDVFTDSTANGKFTYLIVETESNDSKTLINWAKGIKSSEDFLKMPDKTKPAVVTIYFYNPKDTISLDENTTNALKKRYPNNPDFMEKINFAPKGWQYIGHNSKILEGISKDSIFQTLIFVPKEGYKAKDIIPK
ncbi:hypothetical protein MASR1M45_09460 [Candidatus Kapaibacterium sp.]